jgi:hypothetical protein
VRTVLPPERARCATPPSLRSPALTPGPLSAGADASISHPISVLGTCAETILVGGALLTGEAIGCVVEWRARRQYLRRTAADGPGRGAARRLSKSSEGGEAPAAHAVSHVPSEADDNPLITLHPFTLRFSDAAFEQSFLVGRFHSLRRGLVYASGALLPATLACSMGLSRSSAPSFVVLSGFVCTLTAVRVAAGASGIPPEQAVAVFAWSSLGAEAVCWAGFLYLQCTSPIVQPGSLGREDLAGIVVGVVIALGAISRRLAPQHAIRLATHALSVLGFWLLPAPLSFLGQAEEVLLVATSFVLGEFVGTPPPLDHGLTYLTRPPYTPALAHKRRVGGTPPPLELGTFAWPLPLPLPRLSRDC